MQMKNTTMNVELRNESGSIGYVALQTMKGRVIIIDNETTPKMIVKEKYVLARTMNVDLIPSWSHADTGSSGGLKQIKSRKIQPVIRPGATILEML
jgi:hypothetical protein